MNKTLANYYSEGTEIFYGYPADESDTFYNKVPPAIEEQVSFRPMVCLNEGDPLYVVTFTAAVQKKILRLFRDDLGVPMLRDENIIQLDEGISSKIGGIVRNNLVREDLKKKITPGKLAMAQPYIGEDMEKLYQIPTAVTLFLNDKWNLPEYVPAQYLPERYGAYQNGKDFSESVEPPRFPCVVKVSNSSSGDGVRICNTQEEYESVQKEFQSVKGRIIVERCIVGKENGNMGIQFAIPQDPTKPIEILCYSRQYTGNNGEFMGGQIEPWNQTMDNRIERLFLDTILPRVRRMGWYGVGNMDLIADSMWNWYITDPNFRPTAKTAFVFQSANKVIGDRGMITMGAKYPGDFNSLKKILKENAVVGDRNQIMNVVALTEQEDGCNINMALVYDRIIETIQENAEKIKALGFESETLDKILTTQYAP